MGVDRLWPIRRLPHTAGACNEQGRVSVLTESDTSRKIDWLDCSGKPNGNYQHPHDCTRFITCVDGIAWEHDCGSCENRPDNCTPEGRLVYSLEHDACMWPDEVECHSGGNWDEQEPSGAR